VTDRSISVIQLR